MKNSSLKVMFIMATVILLIPAIAMLLTAEVRWSLGDFLVAAVLLYGNAFLAHWMLGKITSTRGRLIAVGSLLVVLILIWMELAVGVFGTPLAGS